MKANEFIKKNRDLLIIYGLAIFITVLLIARWGVLYIATGDSPSYVNAFDSFIQGFIDYERTPVYPFFLGGLKILFGENGFLSAAIILQHMLFLSSIWFFYQTSALLGIPKTIRFWITLAYGCLPYFNIYGNFILSESISTTLFVCFSYFLFSFLKRPKAIFFVIFFILLLLLIFVRPAFLFILPILLCIFCLYYFKASKKVAIQGTIAVIVCSLLLVGYMSSFKKEYGIFSSTSISLVNKYQIYRIYNLIDTERISNSKLRNDILSFLNQNGTPYDANEILWDETSYIFENYKLADISLMLSNSKQKYWKREIYSFFKRLYSSCFTEISTRRYFHGAPLFWIRLLYLYLFTIIYCTVLSYHCYKSIKQKNGMIPWMSIILFLFVTGNIAVAVIGAQSDWGRLITPTLPFVLLMLGQVISPVTKESIDKIAFQ